MAEQREIDGWRSAYKDYSRAELIRVMHSRVEHSAEHIAAKQNLDEIDQCAHRALFAVSSRTLCWTITAAVAAVIGAIAAIIAIFR
jgi:hypothetical protein